MKRDFPLEFGFQCFDCSNTIAINIFMMEKNKPESFTCAQCQSRYRTTLKIKSYEQLDRPYLEVDNTPVLKNS